MGGRKEDEDEVVDLLTSRGCLRRDRKVEGDCLGCALTLFNAGFDTAAGAKFALTHGASFYAVEMDSTPQLFRFIRIQIRIRIWTLFSKSVISVLG